MLGTMRALVVFESMFGNTNAVADAVAEGLSVSFEVETIDVATAASRVPRSGDCAASASRRWRRRRCSG